MSSLRIAPSSAHPTSTSNPTAASRSHQQQQSNSKPSHYPTAPSAPGLPDTLRASLSQTDQPTNEPQPLASTHPLEARLTQWRSTQEQLHHTMLRRTHGLADPLRRAMELHLVRTSDTFFRPSSLGPPSRVHEDILSGRDTELDWEDVYADRNGLRGALGGGPGVEVGPHGELEKNVGMWKW